MNSQADILVYGPDERVRLVAEVKSVRGASAEWAAQFRRNLLVHESIPNAPFFLLVTSDHFYLWKDREPITTPIPPDYEVEIASTLASYIDKLGIPLIELSEPSLEMLVTSWLHTLIYSDLTREGSRREYEWIFDSGLYEALKRSSVSTSVAL